MESKRTDYAHILHAAATEHDQKNTVFIPFTKLKSAIEIIQNYPGDAANKDDRYCVKSPIELLGYGRFYNPHAKKKHLNFDRHFCKLVKEAIFEHDWHRVLKVLIVFLKARYSVQQEYISKAAFILLLNDPIAQSCQALNEFLHMVISCRSDADKETLLNLITTLPEKLPKKKNFIFKRQ